MEDGPREHQKGPAGCQDSTGWSRLLPKTAQQGPESAQDSPRGHSDTPSTTQESTRQAGGAGGQGRGRAGARCRRGGGQVPATLAPAPAGGQDGSGSGLQEVTSRQPQGVTRQPRMAPRIAQDGSRAHPSTPNQAHQGFRRGPGRPMGGGPKGRQDSPGWPWLLSNIAKRGP